MVHWDLRVCDAPELKAMKQWQPEALTSLRLSGCVHSKKRKKKCWNAVIFFFPQGLVEFHIGSMLGLRDLDLSKNNISNILNCGLEMPPKLRRINLSHNKMFVDFSKFVIFILILIGCIVRRVKCCNRLDSPWGCCRWI